MKKNTSLYLAVGLVVLLAIIILIFGLFFLNDKDPREVFDTYFLRFPQVSTLTLDDPVKINGVKLGKVEDIHWLAPKFLSSCVSATMSGFLSAPKSVCKTSASWVNVRSE